MWTLRSSDGADSKIILDNLIATGLRSYSHRGDSSVSDNDYQITIDSRHSSRSQLSLVHTPTRVHTIRSVFLHLRAHLAVRCSKSLGKPTSRQGDPRDVCIDKSLVQGLDLFAAVKFISHRRFPPAQEPATKPHLKRKITRKGM